MPATTFAFSRSRILLLVTAMTGFVLSTSPVQAHQDCVIENLNSTLVTDNFVNQEDGGGPAGDNKLKVNAGMKVNERHCFHILSIYLKRKALGTHGYHLANKVTLGGTIHGGRDPQTYELHPKFQVDAGAIYTSYMNSGAYSVHGQGHDVDQDERHSGQCWVYTGAFFRDVGCSTESPSPQGDPTGSGSLMTGDGASDEFCAMILESADDAVRTPYGAGEENDPSHAGTVIAPLVELTATVPNGTSVVSVEPRLPDPNCPIGLLSINLDDGTRMWIGPAPVLDAWTFSAAAAEISLSFCTARKCNGFENPLPI